MPLTPGTKLGPYEIVAPLGTGGMGEVYRARDSKLNREVALKVLPAAMASDADRMARFQREAQVLASLNHPNIAAIYGLEDSSSVRALEMEIVEGPTLAERIAGTRPLTQPSSVGRAPQVLGPPPSPQARGAGGEGVRPSPIPLDETLHIARQITEALEFAHERGIIHRDLKPANIKITPDGAVKVLDFGLAKALTPDPSGTNISNSPTLTAAATQAGMILGTAAYMSPEQAKGKTVDRRADIWAFGCVLYETLTGTKVFEGETVSETLAAVIKDEPDWGRLSEATPPRVIELVKRCLIKDPKRRLRDIGEARITLEEVQSSPDARPPLTPLLTEEGKREARGGKLWPRTLPWAVAAMASLAAIILAVALWRATRPVEQPLTRLSVDLGPQAMTALNLTTAISPDGRRLVFAAHGPNGKPQLATLLLDQSQATTLPGTENGGNPFFSPDGQWIGFIADGQLKKISVQGGAPVTLCSVSPNTMGANWGDDGSIVLGDGTLSPLYRIPAAGGALEPLSKLAPGEITHRWPQVLPGGGAVLFTGSASASAQDNANIEVLSLKTGQVKILQHGGYYGRYLPSGHLVFLRQGALFGVKFDAQRLEVEGTPSPLLDDVASNSSTGAGQFDFSGAGTFVYLAGKSAAEVWQMAWLDSSGRTQPVLAAPGSYGTPRLSPDGRKLAFVGEGSDVYVHDLDRDTTSRLTFNGRSLVPVWSPDGKYLVFRTTGNDFGILWVRSDGAGEPQQLMESLNILVPWSFSPDGRRLLYFEHHPNTGYDLWTLGLDLADPDHPKPGKPELFLASPADENVPRFSPDGRWVAYRSNESGTDEVYVRPFPPGNGGKWQISLGGGLYALWAKDGRDLFYETADNRIMVMDYTVEGGSFVPSKPRLWCDKQLFYAGTSNLDLAPDGKRFLVLLMSEAKPGEKASVHVTMLLNYFDELRRRIP